MKKCFSVIFVALLLTTLQIRANNIQLTNIALTGQNTVAQFSVINFDVSWENSWRTVTNEANYDGAWIFAKFRKKTSSLWQHATINLTGNTVPANSVLQTSLDGKGVWIYQVLPATDFTGNVNYTGAKIRWNYGVDGVLNTDSVEIKVFAVEMVYIPGGTYKLGSGGTESNHFIDGGSTNPFNVTSEGAINVANTIGNLYYANTNSLGGDQAGPIPAGFPKGYNAFWIMKYEASQQQYVDFVNNLDLARANNRYTGVFTGTHPNLVAPFPERAMNILSITDNLAFEDWAGLRPFTELEFEKVCRGYNQTPIPNEYPWGNTTVITNTTINNSGLPNETGDGNANYGNSIGRPTRSGIYATATSNRQSSGGTFYGVMDMAGNVDEICISVGQPSSRSFTATNGDGNLDINGDANVPTWPLSLGLSYSSRGGSFSDLVTNCRTSDRVSGTYNFAIVNRYAFVGIRGARSAE